MPIDIGTVADQPLENLRPMKKIILKNNGQMTKRDLSYFGGKFGLFERLRLGGIGSPKIIYQSGQEYFDELNEYIENEISFANFELLKDGLLIRLNRNQRFRYIGYQLHEVLSIHLLGTAVENTSKMEAKNRYQNYEGLLRINLLEGTPLQFHVPAIYFQKIQTFFQKPIFEEKFSTEILG